MLHSRSLPSIFVFVTAGALLLAFAPLGNLPAQAPGETSSSQPSAPSDSQWSTAEFWQRLDGEPVESVWEFSDGAVRLARPHGGQASLLSRPLPPNFELSWKYKIQEGTNSGLKYRVRRYGSQWLGVEYQIMDEPLSAEAAADKGSTASIYDLIAPAADKPNKPAGQWNTARVVARGDHLEHYLNGQLVASAVMRGPDWQYRMALSKFYGRDSFGEPVGENRVMLTDHGGEITYKDFHFAALRPESQPAEATAPAAPPQLGNAMRNSWADQSSIVLWTRTTARPQMVTEGPDFVQPDRQLTSKLDQSDDARQQLKTQLPEGASLDQMLGACPGAAGEVRLTYFPARHRHAAKQTEWRTTHAEDDFTCQWKLEGLKAGTEYAAVIEARPVGGGERTAVIRGGFQTAPAANAAEPLKFCMTTCHDFIRRDDGLRGHRIYPTMTELDPAFVIHAGDIEYYDKPRPYAWTIPLMRFHWARIFSLPSNRDFYQRTTAYFIKDDHDTLRNDCWAGQRYGSVSFEEGVRLFNEEQFPSRDPRYQTIRWGQDLQIWVLEGRDYRSPNNMPDGPQKTILGAQQKQWLFDTLACSDATFKLVFSPTPIVGPDRKNKQDNHANDTFTYEGRQIRSELAKHSGVIVFCGDRHWQYASRDQETELWEFGCGPGSENHQLGWKKGDERPEHEFLRVAGGFLSGELSYETDSEGKESAGKRPRLVLRHRKVTGDPVSEFIFPQP